jgi:hypothetical protein
VPESYKDDRVLRKKQVGPNSGLDQATRVQPPVGRHAVRIRFAARRPTRLDAPRRLPSKITYAAKAPRMASVNHSVD